MTRATKPIAKRTLQNGYAIRTIRELSGMTTQDLAKALLITPPAVRNYENEHRSVTPDVLVKIAAALGCNPLAITRETQPFGQKAAA